MQYSYFAGIGWARWSTVECLWVYCEALAGLDEPQGRSVVGLIAGAVIVVYRPVVWGIKGGRSDERDAGGELGSRAGREAEEVFEVPRGKAA